MKIFKNRFLVIGTTVILVSILSIFISCSKDLTSTEKISELDNLRMNKVVLTAYNQKLLNDFLTNTKKYFVQSGLDTRSINPMLQFVDESSYSSYNLALDNLANSWDALNGVTVPSGSDFVLSVNPGNPAFNAVDQALNFGSARYDYSIRRELSGDRNFELPISEAQVSDPYLQRVMNINEEVQVGDFILKQLPNNVLAKVPAFDIEALENVRLLGVNTKTKVILLDGNTGEVTTKGTLSTRGSCTFLAFANQLANSTTVKASSILKDMNGGGCGGIFRYNFGDGTSEVNTTDGGLNHGYDVPLGTSKTFTIKVTYLAGTPGTSCAACNSITATVTVQVTNFGSCHFKEWSEQKKFIDFNARNGSQDVPACITTKFGFRGQAAGSFIQTAAPKVWLNTYLEIFKDGKWRSSTPGVPIVISTHGFVKTNDCSFDSPANFSKSTMCSSDELLRTDSGSLSTNEQVPSFFGIIETNRNISLWGRVAFGSVIYDKPFWEWSN
jgi:hypothetical protein